MTNYSTVLFTHMAQSEEELKSLLMKMKEESEKVSLKLSIKKTIPFTIAMKRIKYLGINRWGNSGKCQTLPFWAPKSLQMVIA